MAASNSFTTTSSSIVSVLSSQIKINNAFEKKVGKEYSAIWDTGATNSAISPRIAKELNLTPTGMVKMNTASGVHETYTYVVDMVLPSGILINKLQVTQAELNSTDVLIGMDIINQGDFAISNYRGKTSFSFRIPSISKTDYVEETKRMRETVRKGEITVSRNSKCPCGSGKKYKQCCGVINNK